MVIDSLHPAYYIRNIISLKKSLWKRHWQWLWLIAFIGGLIFVVRDVHSQQLSPIQLGVIHRPLSFLIITLFILPWLFKYKTVMLQGVIAPLTLLSIWQILSSVWSDYTLWTLYRSLEYLLIVMLTAYTAASLKDLTDIRKWMNFVWFFIAILIASVWVGIVVFPKEAIVPLHGTIPPIMIRGVFPVINPNSVAHLAGVLTIVGLCRLFEKDNKKWLILIIWGVVTMVLSHGRSGIAGFVIALMLVLMLHRRVGLTLAILVCIITLIITINFDQLFIEFFRRGQSHHLFLGLSGRLHYWEHAWQHYIMRRPLLGYGAFAGTRFLVMPEIISSSAASSTHNSWIELLVNVGFPGAIMFLFAVTTLWFGLLLKIKNSLNTLEKCILIEAIAVLAVLLVRSAFTSVFVEHSQYPFFVVLGVLAFSSKNKVVKITEP